MGQKPNDACAGAFAFLLQADSLLELPFHCSGLLQKSVSPHILQFSQKVRISASYISSCLWLVPQRVLNQPR